jgi:NitT/TauT family transport system substrate-binding protein
MPLAVLGQGRLGRWVTALATACLLLVACGSDKPATPPPLRVGIDVWPGYYPIAIAQQQGLLAKRGVDVSVYSTQDTNALLAEFAAGKHDIVGVALGDAITLSRVRPDVVVLMITDESAGGDEVLQRADFVDDGVSPIRVGTNMGGFGELFLRTYVERQGIDPKRLVWIDTDGSQVPEALASSALDVGHTWQPYTTQSKERGAKTLFSSMDTPGLILDVYLTTRPVMETRGKELQQLTEAWFEAAEWWKANPSQGDSVAAAALKIDPTTVSLQGVRLYTLDDNHAATTGGPAAPLAKLIDRYSDFFVERGSLSTPPEAMRMMHPELFEPQAGNAE